MPILVGPSCAGTEKRIDAIQSMAVQSHFAGVFSGGSGLCGEGPLAPLAYPWFAPLPGLVFFVFWGIHTEKWDGNWISGAVSVSS